MLHWSWCQEKSSFTGNKFDVDVGMSEWSSRPLRWPVLFAGSADELWTLISPPPVIPFPDSFNWCTAQKISAPWCEGKKITWVCFHWWFPLCYIPFPLVIESFVPARLLLSESEGVPRDYKQFPTCQVPILFSLEYGKVCQMHLGKCCISLQSVIRLGTLKCKTKGLGRENGANFIGGKGTEKFSVTGVSQGNVISFEGQWEQPVRNIWGQPSPATQHSCRS